MRLEDDEPAGGDGEEPSACGSEDALAGKSKMLVRLVAGGFLLIGAMDVGLYWLKCHHEQVSVSIWRTVYLSIPLVIGAAILIKTPALARRIDDWLEQ